MCVSVRLGHQCLKAALSWVYTYLVMCVCVCCPELYNCLPNYICSYNAYLLEFVRVQCLQT